MDYKKLHDASAKLQSGSVDYEKLHNASVALRKTSSTPIRENAVLNGYTPVADLNRATNGAGVSSTSGILEQAARDMAATLPEARTPRTTRTYWDGTTRERQDRGAMLRGVTMPAPENGGAWDRIKSTVTGGAKQSASGHLGAIGAYTEAAGALSEAAANVTGNSGRVRAAEREAERNRRLAETAQTPEMQEYYARKAERAERKVRAVTQPTVDSAQTDAIARNLYNTSDALAASGAEDIARAKEGTGFLGGLAVDLGAQATQMLGDRLIGGVTGLGGLVPMIFRSFGGGAQEARLAGASLGQQLGYGAANALVEGLTESMFDGLAGAYGKGTADEVVKNIINRIAKNDAAKRALTVAAAAAGESAEELASGIAGPFIRAIYNGKSIGQNWSETQLADIGYDMLVGGLLGSVGGGVEVTSDALYQAALERAERGESSAETRAQTTTQQVTAAPAGVSDAELVAATATNDRVGISEPSTAQRMGESEAREALPLRGVSEQQLDRDLADAARLSVTLGRSGANAFLTAYDRATAASVEPTEAFESFSKVYNAAVRGENAPEVSMPEHLRIAAQGAGENDARTAAQAQYFGENAGLAPNRSGRPRNLSRREARVLDAIGKAAGVQIKFADTMNGANASIENGVLTIAKDADDPVRAAFTHEIVHRVRESAPEAYSTLAQFVVDNMSDERLGSAIRARSDAYSDMNYSVSDITEETVADAFGRMASEPELLEKIAGVDRTAAQKILDAIDELLRKIKAALSGKKQAQLTANQMEAFRDLQGRGEEMANALRAALQKVQEQAQTAANESVATAGEEARYSRNVDSEYMAAIERGDMDEAARIVRETADKAGYTVEAYHGTMQFGFTRIDTGKSDDKISFFATNDPLTAQTYSATDGVREVHERGYTVAELEDAEDKAINALRSEASGLAGTLSREAGVQGFIDADDLADHLLDIVDSGINNNEQRGVVEDQLFEYLQELASDVFEYTHRDVDPLDNDYEYQEWVESKKGQRVQTALDGAQEKALAYLDARNLPAAIGNYHLFINPEGMLEVEGNGANWNKIPFMPDELKQMKARMDEIERAHVRGTGPLTNNPEWLDLSNRFDERAEEILNKYHINPRAYSSTREVARYAVDNGYTGVRFKNIVDDGGQGMHRVYKPSDVYIMFNPQAQAKSADPVTYADDGTIIPLSERFNTQNSDIRYSRNVDSEGRNLTEAQAEYFKDSKVRDENGKLLVLYHGGFATGGNGDGNVFAGRGSGFAYNPNSIYLTNDKNVAQAFGGRHGRLYELYADIKNPIVLDAQGRNYTDIPIADDAPESLKDYFLMTETADADNIPVYAEEYGYDGVIIYNVREGVGGEPMTEVIALRPEQVKDVSNQTPSYDPDIRFSRKLGEERIFRTPQGVEVVQNPTDSEYAQMRSEVYRAYPWLRETGEPPLRRTFDEDGNVYYWSSADGIHAFVEPYINREFDTRTSQHWKWWEKPDKDDYPTRYSRKSVADAEAREAALLQENDLLREEIRYWKAQLERTPEENVGIVDPNAVRKAAKKLIADYGSTLAHGDITNELQDLYNLMGTGSDKRGELSYESAREIADSVARKIAENAVDDTESAYRMYEDLRSFLRTMDLTVTAAETTEIADWGDWRKQNFGRMQVKRGETSNIDRIYDELSDAWPEFFPGDVLTVGDQLNRIAEVAEYLYRDRGHNPYDPYMDQAVIDIGNDIMERFFDLPQAKTFADKQAAKIETLRVQMSEIRARDSERLQRSLAKVRESRDKQIERMTERFRAKTEEGRERQSAAKLRKQIMRHTSALSQKLLRPTDKQHIPDSLRAPVAAMLEAINKESAYDIVTDETCRNKRVPRGEGDVFTKRTQAFAELKKKYAELKDDENLVIDPDLLGDEEAGFQGLFDQVLAMSGTPIQRMSTEQLQTVWKVVRAVEHSVSTYGKTLSAAKFKTTADWAFWFRSDASYRKDRATIGGKDISLGLENPYTFFSQYGESGKAIFRMLRDAQDTQRRRMDRIADAVHGIADSKTVKELRETRREFTTERGDTLTLTTAQIMELYNLTKREQAQNHLLKGGIVQPEIPAAGKQKRIERGTDMIRLTQADLGELAALLTPEQMEIADALQQLTATTLAEWGNEASMAAYGYRKFTEQNYWPIHTAQEALHSKVENDRSNPRSIKNIGMAKALVPNASNAVSVGDVFTTFAEHAADMIDYSSWLLPMEDANRLFNFKYKGDDGYPASTFKQELDRVGGRNGKAQKYWTDLMADIQNGLDRTSRSDLEGLAARGIGNVKGASVGANLRVIVQQPTAYLRANAVMNPESLTKGLIGGVTRGNGWQKAQQYAAIARIKDVGGFDQSSTRSVSNELYSDRTALEKVGDFAGWPAGKADAVTWGALWNAAEWETKRLHPDIAEGSAAFYQKAAEIFTDAIDQTQVVDGVLQRSAIMRSGDRLTQQMTAFMGEPLMALNLMLRSYDNVRYAKTKEQRGAAIRQLGRAVVTLAVTDIVNSAVQSLVDALRKDDKDKDYWDRFMTALTGLEGDEKTAAERLKNIYLEGNFADNASLIGRIPLAKDLRSILQGFTVERLDAGAISDLMQSAQQLASGKYAPVYGAYRVAEQAAKIVGIPATNLERDVHAAVRSIIYAIGDSKLLYEYEKAIFNSRSTKNKSRFFATAYMALEQGDTATYETIRNDLVEKMGVSAFDVDDDMKKRYNKAVKEDGNYTVPQASADLLAIRQKYSVKTETEEEKFKAEDLGAAAYTRYSNQRARDYKTYKDALEKTTEFRKLSAEDKDRALNWAYSLADEMALEENSDGQYKMTDKWKTYAKDAKRYGISMTNYLTFHMVAETTSSTRDKNGKEVKGQKKADKLRDWLENWRGLTDGQRAWLWGTIYSSEW